MQFLLAPILAASTFAQAFLGIWDCALTIPESATSPQRTVQATWTFEQIAGTDWTRVTYASGGQTGGFAIVGFLPQIGQWVYNDFHNDGSYAHLTAPNADNTWRWSGDYFAPDGSVQTGSTNTWTLDSPRNWRITVVHVSGKTEELRESGACTKR